jgi:hypothetical protein
MDDPARAGAALELAEGESRDSGPCECCGRPGTLAWGFVNDAAAGPVCVYYVHWTHGRPDHAAHFDLIVGPWGEGTRATDRIGVSLTYRRDAGAFTVIDAAARSFAQGQQLFARALRREDVVATPISATGYRMVDAIWLGDSRIGEVRAPCTR